MPNLIDAFKKAFNKEPWQFRYRKEMSEASVSGFKKMNNDSRDIIIDFKDSRFAPIVENSIKPVNELGIQIFDEEKTTRALETVNKKYENELKQSKFGMGLGTGGPAELVGFFVDAGIRFTILWIGQHVLSDFDNAAWEKVKHAIISIFKSSQSFLKKTGIPITTHYKPQIIFVLPSNLKENELAAEMDEIIKITKKILEENPDPHIAYKYTYNTQTHAWELETIKMNAI